MKIVDVEIHQGFSACLLPLIPVVINSSQGHEVLVASSGTSLDAALDRELDADHLPGVLENVGFLQDVSDIHERDVGGVVEHPLVEISSVVTEAHDVPRDCGGKRFGEQ